MLVFKFAISLIFTSLTLFLAVAQDPNDNSMLDMLIGYSCI